jgi:branched-chain amino acid transport system permease protein
MTPLAQQALASGLLQGLIYSFIALGLLLTFGVLKVANFAHGYFVAGGMYVVYMVGPSSFGAYLLSLLVAFAVGLAAGLIVERVVLEKTLIAGGEHMGMRTLVPTFAVALIIQNLLLILVSSPVISLKNPYPFSAVRIGSAVLEPSRLVGTVLSLIFGLAVMVLLYRSRFGLLVRACVQSNRGAVICGVNIRKSYRFVFAGASGLAAVAGGLILPFTTAPATVGFEITLKAFLVVIIGGMASVRGLIIAGIFFGLVEAFITAYVSGALALAVLFGFFVVIVLIRPSGLSKAMN